MTTRAQLRTVVRERLEDTVGAPLWSDDALNGFLESAMRAYGSALSRAATANTAPVAIGAIGVALPAGVSERSIVTVRDGRGRDVPPSSDRIGPAPADSSTVAQAWRAWAGTLRLQRPASGDEAGVWSIDYRAARELVGDDVSAQPIEAGDEPIVVALAAAQAALRRAVEDGKRSAGASPMRDLAADLFDEAERAIASRKRRARGGVMALA